MPEALLVDHTHDDRFSSVPILTICVDEDDTAAKSNEASQRQGELSLLNLAYVIYTSGSTGARRV